ncbi:hypothetical protein H2201_001257 [Coniosporium apollinis]|uniref:Proteinase inhibitor I78 n=2 Tax=Coniosporium TaxID=2810619 RepID=A0ABQ9P231_9PEZI|nr:hypothetical protein H2199_001666 [Cladosporium sp. JES 115]KAJ9668615.1 hypothetical protein H2201_001257 [Coniosporium apollinis]
MPLVVPGLMGKSGASDDSSKWQEQLMGKKLGDVSDNTTFARKELPKETRVLKQGDMATMDFKPDRLNVHVADDGTVTHVKMG